MSVLARVVTCGIAAILAIAPNPAWADQQRARQWWLSTWDIAGAHAITRGAGVTVAVVDSGVDATHPDLAGALVPDADPAATRDADGRGTALAALIAGRGHGVGGVDGVLGVAPAASILPIAFAPKAGEPGTADLLAAGIDQAVSRGAGVICIGRGVRPSLRLREAVESALDHRVVVVAADGNRPGETFSAWPSSIIGVLTPVVLTRDGTVAVPPASARTTGLGVPGTELVTAGLAGGYRSDGSAAGLLCGAVALIRALSPQLGPAEVGALLRATATDHGVPGPDSRFGSGVLDLTRALNAAPRTESPVAAPSRPIGSAPQPVPTASPSGWRPLAESGDWGRWLLVLPLLGFLVGFVAYAVRRHRRPWDHG